MAKKAKPEAPAPMTPQEIRELRERLKLSFDEAGAWVGVSGRAWKSWEQPSQDRVPSASSLILLHQLRKGQIGPK